MRSTRLLLLTAVLLACLGCTGCGLLLAKIAKARGNLTPTQTTTASDKPASNQTTEAKPAGDKPSDESAASQSETVSDESANSEPPVIHGSLPKPAGDGVRPRYIPVGAERTLTISDLSGLSAWQLDVLRNEIYAAHGRSFKRADLRNYFASKSWYHEDASYSDSRLSSLEKRNAEFIAQQQRQRGQVQGGSTRSGGSGSSHIAGDGQVLYWSSARTVTAADLAALSSWELDIARNEIYARHGRSFKRADLRRYFRSLPWYHEDSGFSEARLSGLEKRNAEYMRNYQTGR